MVRGRRTSGPRLAEGTEGTDEAKLRLKVSLETITGQRSVKEACEILGLCEAAFYKIRSRCTR